MRADAYALSYAQQRIIDTDVIGDNKIISLSSIGVVGIGSDADAMFLIAKGEIVGNHRVGGCMPEINATTCIIIGDIIENMAVLQGGSAMKLYGEKAKNGAIIITTKKGKK